MHHVHPVDFRNNYIRCDQNGISAGREMPGQALSVGTAEASVKVDQQFSVRRLADDPLFTRKFDGATDCNRIAVSYAGQRGRVR